MKKQILIFAFIFFSANSFAAENTPRLMGPPEEAPPEGTQTMEGHSGEGVLSVMPETSQYPDYPLNSGIPTQLSVKFLFDHRSALNGQQVTVNGVVIKTLLLDQSCKTSQGHNPLQIQPGMCAQPRIVIADTNNSERDTNYDTTVMLAEEDNTAYQAGQKITVTGLVSANSNFVMIHKGNEVMVPRQ